MMPKSRRKEKFLFLKQILEESASDKENDAKKYATEPSTKSDGSAQTETEKKGKDNAGPVGKYPVLFKKTCQNKSCQTRLSSFPLFPLPEETEWISDEEGEKKNKTTALKKKKKQSRSVSKDSNKDHVEKPFDYSETQKLSKVKNSDGSRKTFKSEHQLKETDNPILQAWLHKKAIVARKQRKLERKEKRAKRAALEEEARIQAERDTECNQSVGEWFKRKHKEARIAWRKSRTRVSPHEVDTTIQRGDSPPRPPPEYKVVRSFKYTKSSTGHMAENTLVDESTVVNGAIPVTKSPMTSCSEDRTDLDTKGGSNISENITSNRVKCRPKTAVDRTENVSSSRPKTAKRPKTSRERSLKSPATQTTTSTSNGDSPKKMQSLSYDNWLKVKRDGDKDKMIQKKRELIDSHLQAVIKELGKKRVEKIMSPRKQVDTGLKNAARSPDRAQSASSKVKPKKGSPYRWILSKNPRPEPQGCDGTENQRTDRTAGLSCHQHVKNDGGSKQPEVHISELIDEKYNELKPSIEKVKDILDAEIRKLKESGKGLDTKVDKPSQQIVDSSQTRSLTMAGNSSVNEAKLSRPVSARPSSARPTTARPSTARPGSAYLTKEQAKKIASDMDVLGLCDSSDPEQEEIDTETDVDVKHDTKSTVRENYFDYGSDVDPPTMEPAEFVP